MRGTTYGGAAAAAPGEDSLARVERVFVWSAVSSSSSLKALAEEWLMVW
jgi:hypothetical protein